MRHFRILLGAVLLGLLAFSFTAYAEDPCFGCYKKNRKDGIKMCEKGQHQKAIEYFLAAKACKDAPAVNDIDDLIAACRVHMSEFRILALEFGNSRGDDTILSDFGQPLYSESMIYLKPQIAYTSVKSEIQELGFKVYRPDGKLDAADGYVYSYTEEFQAKAGNGVIDTLNGFGNEEGGDFPPGEYTFEIWNKGKCIYSSKFTIKAGKDPNAPKPMLTANGEESPRVEFPYMGGRMHVTVENRTGSDYEILLLPDFCTVENQKPDGFDMVCEVSKSPAVKTDWFYLSAGDEMITIYVNQATYAKASYLTVDGNSENYNVEMKLEGERMVFFVRTDCEDYEVTGIPFFCTLDGKDKDKFYLDCPSNVGGYYRTDYFWVKAGEFTITIYVTQEGTEEYEDYEDGPGDGDGDDVDREEMVDLGELNFVSSPSDWIPILKRVMENPTSRYEGGCYKGLKDYEDLRSGYGAYMWDGDSFHFGYWEEGQQNGKGIYLIGNQEGFHFNNCPGAVVFVGSFIDGKANGIGSCYNKDGVLIYDGEFEDGVPVETYPNGDNLWMYRFQIIHSSDGYYYVGETRYDKYEGYGIVVWDDYDAWFGNWGGGNRGTGLFMTRDGNTIEVRNYDEIETAE